jgi:putative acetyltransferase
MKKDPSSSTVTIRRAEPEDYLALHKIYSGPKAFSGTLQLPYPSVEGWRKRLEEPRDGFYFLLACVEEEVIGSLGLHTFPKSPRRLHVGQIGMGVRDDWQGKGVGTALMQAAVDMADNWLQLTRLELQVYTDNQAGIHLYEKFGFQKEGTHRHFAFRDGQYVDAYAMARLHPRLEK